MIRIAVIGANGQVGAELCLLLANRPDVELVPVCRTRSGSAFLRWKGIACRHGRAADPADAARLFGDCDIIVNSSLATGSPAQIRSIEDSIIDNVFEQSLSRAIIIHFSTQSVYGDPLANRLVRWRNPYGRVKLATERRIARQSKRCRKPAYILRLGHVCGALQEISESIRAQIRQGRVVLPENDHSSNTVHVSAIAGAVQQIIRGDVQPGTYDMMNEPRWSWRQVYEFEAGALHLPLTPIIASPLRRPSLLVRIVASSVRFASTLAATAPVRNAATKCFAYVPQRLNARAMAWWYARRARAEITALDLPVAAAEHLSWVENGHHFFPADQSTMQLIEAFGVDYLEGRPATTWASDLPAAGIDASDTRSRNIAFTSAR